MGNINFCSVTKLFPTLCDTWTTACQAPLSSTVSQGLLKFISFESMMLYNHPILCCPLLLLPSIFPSIRVFSSESVLRIQWPKYWSFSFSITPHNEFSGLIPLGWTDLISLQSLEPSPTPPFKRINSLALSLLYGPTFISIHEYWNKP